MPAAVSCMICLMVIPLPRAYHSVSDGYPFLLPADLEIPRPRWIAVMIVNIWAVAPFCALNILSTKNSSPPTLHEAGPIDAGLVPGQQFYSSPALITSPRCARWGWPLSESGPSTPLTSSTR